MIQEAIFYLKASRPGLWFATVWLYLLPTSQMGQLANEWTFWFGLFYVCFPLNLMVYGWNDAVDYETDALNPRKDSFWFGARGTREQLAQIWKPIVVVQLLCAPFLVYLGGWQMILLLIAFVVINGVYNLPNYGLRSQPPLEILCQVGYLLVVPLSILINTTAQLPWQTYLYLLLFAIQSHIMGEVMDIEPDRKAKRRTTATELGMRKTKLLIIVIVLIEVVLLFTIYREYIFGGLLAGGLLWLLIDLFLIFKTKTYTVGQMKLFAFASNVISVISMAYVWYSGCLLNVH